MISYSSLLRTMPALYTLLEFSLIMHCVLSGSKVCNKKNGEISILYDVTLSGIQVSMSLEYFQAHLYKRLLTCFFLYFLRDSALDFIFPLLSPH